MSITVSDCSSREEALRRFLHVIDEQSERVQATKNKLEKIYRFQTPSEPFFSYDIQDGHTYQPSSWVSDRCEYKLDTAMQRIMYNLRALPQADFLPVLSAHPGDGGGAGGVAFFPILFGGRYEITSGGAFLPRFYLVRDLVRDIDRLPEIDITRCNSVQEALEDTQRLIEYTRGKVCIGYPYMQGCLNNAYRFMDQQQMLMACIEAKQHMRRLLMRIYRVRSSIIRAVRGLVGNDELLRIRGHHPAWVRGLVVDDYISVVGPEDYYDVCCEVWQAMHDESGPIYLHTCGPISQCVGIYRRLPGLLASEFVYAEKQQKTTHQVAALKHELDRKTVLYSLGLPTQKVVDDMENLTPEWLRQMSAGGGFMLNGCGSLEEGRALVARLEL